MLWFFFDEVYVFIESKAMEERLVKIEFPCSSLSVRSDDVLHLFYRFR